uniref:Uncharacterized protein n=1 Tax=Rhizophora mucronata TaxID=61149 RepID=A0A2P2PDR2_RHIMU
MFPLPLLSKKPPNFPRYEKVKTVTQVLKVKYFSESQCFIGWASREPK